MLIDSDIARRFMQEYKRFLLSIYEPDGTAAAPLRTVEKLHAARKRFIANRSLLDDYMKILEDGTDRIDREILLAIKNIEYSRWVYLRDLKAHSIFLKDGGGCGYGVLGLTDELHAMTGGAGAVVEAGIFAFDEHYVCDGLIANLMQLGPNIRRSYDDLYKELREAGKFKINPLLPQMPSEERRKTRKPVKRPDETSLAGERKAVNDSDARKQARIDEVAALLETYSAVHLTPELGGYARKLWEQLGRKRTYTITGGAKEVWAAAVVYMIARLNFLFDSHSENFLSADSICAYFGVKKTTVSARAAGIEKACKIRMGQEGLCSPDIADSLTFVKLSNGFVIPKKKAREAGLI